MRAMISGKDTGRIVGSTYIKSGRQVVLMKIFDGFGVSRHMLTNPRIKNIRIHYNGLVYKASSATYLLKGIPYTDKSGRYEPQVILPRNQFDVVNADQTELFNV